MFSRLDGTFWSDKKGIDHHNEHRAPSSRADKWAAFVKGAINYSIQTGLAQECLARFSRRARGIG